MAKLPDRTVEIFDPTRYNIINGSATLDAGALYSTAASGGRHKGTYRDGMNVTTDPSSLEKSIHSRTEQAIRHMLKIEDPYIMPRIGKKVVI